MNGKSVIRFVARKTLGALPSSAWRLTGLPARLGGKPVRDTRIRPWPKACDGNLWRWHKDVRGLFRRIYLSGVEGLPQPLAAEFARQWADYCGCRYGLLLGHGTDAIRIALAAALDLDGLEYGGDVIVPNFSFIASATAVLDRRCGVVLVDVDPDTLLLDPKSVEAAIEPGKTRAIMPVHLFGQPANMPALRALAARHDLKIIEDAAQAHGARASSGMVGALGDAGAFSFQSSKNLSAGEGGALTTNDEQLYARAYAMHNAGRSAGGGGRWFHESLGWNCRMTEYQAGLLQSRFRYFPEQQARRAPNFKYLAAALGSGGCLRPLAVASTTAAHGMYMFAMRYRSDLCGGWPLDRFMDLLAGEGAPIYRAFEKTIFDQPAMGHLSQPAYLRKMPTPVADQAVTDTVYIAHDIFLGTKRDMDDIAHAIAKIGAYCRAHKAAE